MSKYPFIESMGLDVHTEFRVNYVHANDLEKALQDSPIWYGDKDIDSWSTSKVWADTTHTARLVCIQPMKKKTKGEAAIGLLTKIHTCKDDWDSNDIKKILDMPE